MKIKFLGTGSVWGVPEWNCGCSVCSSRDPKDKRMRCSLLVQIGSKNIVIDFGPDFRTQLLKYKIKKLDYALLTHAHGDHMNGYMELARQKNLVLEAREDVLKDFFERLGHSKGWLATRNPSMKIKPFEKKRIGGVEIDFVALRHKKDFDDRDAVPCCGVLFRTKKSKFAYLSDYDEILEPEKLKGLDLLVSDGSGFNTNRGHAGVMGSVRIFRKLKPKRMILTHIRHTEGHASLSKLVKRYGNIEVAYDGMELEIK